MFGPFPSVTLVRRELLVSLRKVRLIVYASLVVLACMGGVALVWPATQNVRTMAAQTSVLLLNVVTVVLMAGCGLFLPGLAATAISNERDEETYDQLHLSLITPRGMIFGKMLNALGVYGLLAISVLPVLGVTFFMVGLSWEALFWRGIVIAWMAVAIGAVGLYCSACFQRTATAIAVSYFGALFVFGIPWFVVFIILESPRIRISNLIDVENVVRVLVPPAVLEGSLARGIKPTGALIYLTLFSAFFFWRTLRALRQPPKARAVKQEKPIDDAALLQARRKRFPYYLIDPLKRKKTVEDGRNPVLVRELRWGVLGRMTVMVRVFYGALAADWAVATLFMIWNMRSYQSADGTVPAMVALIACTVLPAPVLLSSLFVKEREQGNLEMLRMTLLRPTQIVVGKFGAAAIQLSPLLVAAVLTTFVVVSAFGAVSLELDAMLLSVLGLVTLIVCMWTVAALSLTVSLVARRTASALVGTYALALMLFIGTPTALHAALQSVVMRRMITSQFRNIYSMTASSFSPVFSYAGLIEGSWDTALTFWMASCFMFSLLGAALLLFCIYLVNRRPSRARRQAEAAA